jgi:hypothetical protein
MAITIEAFDDRNGKAWELALEGELNVLWFVRVFNMEWEDLVHHGLLRPRPSRPVNGFVPYSITTLGRTYLKRYTEDDLVVVRPERSRELLALLSKR